MFGKTALALTSFGLLASAGPARHHGPPAHGPPGPPPPGYPPSPPPTQDASQLISDPLVNGPALELVHLYYDEFPTGKVKFHRLRRMLLT